MRLFSALRNYFLCISSCLSLLTVASIASADWPQFRGADSSGADLNAVVPAILDPQKHITWEAALPGRGLASPIIIGDRVFVTCSSGPRQTRLHVICFRATDGGKLWERQFFATGRTLCHEKTSVAANSPASDGSRLFALFSCNDVVALDFDGNLLWLRALTLDYPNVSNSLGMASSLAVAAGTLIVQVENDSQPLALGLDVETGVNRWQLDRPKRANWTSPVIFPDPVSGDPLVGLQSSAGVQAVEPATGREVWRSNEGASTVASTTVSGGVLLVPSHGITALKPGSPGETPIQLWRAQAMRPDTSTPVALGDRFYVLNGAGVLSAGDMKTGERLWQLRMKGPFSASPVMAGRFLYIPNENGLLQVVDTAKPEGEIVSELDLRDTILSTPSISGNALFIRSDRKLWKISGT